MICFLESGQRLRKPSLCPIDIYNIITDCWKIEAPERPSFRSRSSAFLPQHISVQRQLLTFSGEWKSNIFFKKRGKKVADPDFRDLESRLEIHNGSLIHHFPPQTDDVVENHYVQVQASTLDDDFPISEQEPLKNPPPHDASLGDVFCNAEYFVDPTEPDSEEDSKGFFKYKDKEDGLDIVSSAAAQQKVHRVESTNTSEAAGSTSAHQILPNDNDGGDRPPMLPLKSRNTAVSPGTNQIPEMSKGSLLTVMWTFYLVSALLKILFDFGPSSGQFYDQVKSMPERKYVV